MASGINLADPACEPTDEELQDLARRAFAHVAEANRRSAERLERSIAERRERVRELVRAMIARPR